MSEEKEKIFMRAECPVCFLNYTIEMEMVSLVLPTQTLVNQCEYCQDRPWLRVNKGAYKKMLLTRMLEVMPHTSMARLPEILRLMATAIKWEDE